MPVRSISRLDAKCPGVPMPGELKVSSPGLAFARATSSLTEFAGTLLCTTNACGPTPSRVIGVHLLKNILIPLVTVIGLELGSVIAFAVVTETVFAWPGMGKLVIDSIFQLDRPVVVAYLLVTVFMFILINLAVDLLYSALDPRVRLQEAR